MRFSEMDMILLKDRWSAEFPRNGKKKERKDSTRRIIDHSDFSMTRTETFPSGGLARPFFGCGHVGAPGGKKKERDNLRIFAKKKEKGECSVS